LLETIPIAHWQGPFANAEQRIAVKSLEKGNILFFPNLSFTLEGNGDLLSSSLLSAQTAKNISYNAADSTLKGTIAADQVRTRLQAMMEAFSAAAARLVCDLFPLYSGNIERGRASYRPVEISGREYSRLKDDRLLHVDAFPSTPTNGRRILRLFCNVDPSGKARLWHVGEPFEEFHRRFLPTIRRPAAPVAWLLAAIGVTRGRRSPYDQLMLGLHNCAKRCMAFQTSAAHAKIAFPAGSSWLCFTDQVVHAAVAGQYALEQTFYLNVEAMADPDRSPLKILERATGRKLH
jgi:hypothetical protein